jgi:hypothetical protein
MNSSSWILCWACRAQPFTDAEALLPTCYRCGATSALLNLQGDHCSTCGSATTRSFASFEPLPLVEFELEAGISDEEVQQVLGTAVESSSRCAGRVRGSGDDQRIRGAWECWQPLCTLHLCLAEPLSKVPPGRWLCPSCEVQVRNGAGKPLVGDGDGGTCAASAGQSPPWVACTLRHGRCAS